MNEWLMILMMALGGSGFAIGGTGPKYVRRFILPITFGALAFWAGIEWWRCVGLGVGLCTAFHLGYGERTSYPMKFLTACSFILPTFFLGFSLWQVFTPLAFIGMFWLSNNRYWDRLFPWKIVEFLTGTFIAVTIVQLIQQTFN